MKKHLKVSIIIPIYNTEQYLIECLESVLKQTYQNLEVILVDDGSTDESALICEQYAEQDDRIIFLQKKNGGLSSARNYGIRFANGDYVIFLDSDDFFDDEQAIDRLMIRLSVTKADVLNYSYVKYNDVTKEKKPYFNQVNHMPIGLTDKMQQVSYLMDNHLYIASACNKAVRREVLDNPSLEFKPGVYSEDIEWCARLLLQARSMDFVCDNFYMYRQRASSISHTISDRKCEDLRDHIVACINLAESAEGSMQNSLFQYAAYQFGTFFVTQAMAENRQEHLINSLKDYKWILRYHNGNHKLKYLYIACSILGYPNLCHLIRKVYDRKYRRQ